MSAPAAVERCWIEPDWAAPPGVCAAFTLRTGGVSAPPYESLNLGAHVGDAPQAVAENRRRVRWRLALPAEPVWLEQVHGAQVQVLTAAPGGVPRADAAVTRERGVVCAIQVADCMPVLFASRDGAVIGAAHAGWRGLAGGVLEAALAALACPAQDTVAWLGPAIGAESFEVGEEVRAAFLAADPAAAAAFVRNGRGRWQCDLGLLARQRLAAHGVAAVSGAGLCTVRDPAQFFSFRRDGRTGRMAALIWKR